MSSTFPHVMPSQKRYKRKPTLQKLLETTLRNTAIITGKTPTLRTIPKSSPLSTYATSRPLHPAERPYDIIAEIEKTANPCLVVDLYRGVFIKHGYVIAPTKLDHVNHAGRAASVSNSQFKVVDKKVTPTTHRRPATTTLPRVSRAQLVKHAFPYEIQNIIHAYGDVRYCTEKVLSFIENAVRNVTQRLIRKVLAQFQTDTLTVRDLSTCLRHDPRALHRLLYRLRSLGLRPPDTHVVKPITREWDAFRHKCLIKGVAVGEFPRMEDLEQMPCVSIHLSCSQKCRKLFPTILGRWFDAQHTQCMRSNLTDRYSRCPTSGIGGRRRLDLFREWLGLPRHVVVNEAVLHALGHIAKEAIGVLVQTALVIRYGDYFHASYERMLIDALGYGMSAAVMVPLSTIQAYELVGEVVAMDHAAKHGRSGFRDGREQGAVEIQHVKEAWRRLDGAGGVTTYRGFWLG